MSNPCATPNCKSKEHFKGLCDKCYHTMTGHSYQSVRQNKKRNKDTKLHTKKRVINLGA
jgi:hypothetical protein